MSDKFYLIPNPGMVVRDPVSAAPLPPDGAEKPKTGYWLRRVMDGDVVVGTEPTPAADTHAPPRKHKPKE